ncbi:MAG: hypothetical protein RL662_879 [Bacteroidota bacterium]|jgi:uncharacterized pyridoxamine 5'-phosphate oxidase family protein
MEKVLTFLKKNFVTTIATSSNDKPRTSIVEYYMIGDSLVFATSVTSIKANNLKANNRISLSVATMPQFVTLDGTVTTPTNEEIEAYNKLLLAKHPEFVEMMSKGMIGPFVYYKVLIDTVYFNDYSTGMAPTEIIKA